MAPFGAAAQNVLSPISPVTPSHHITTSTTSGLAPLAQNHPLAAATPSTVSDGTSHGNAAAAALHKRVYQACIPCRRRKVRCDLGSVDHPHDPPCVRCRRESKECFFSATRRKRKVDDPEDELEQDEYIIRNGRKQLRASEAAFDRRLYSDVPLTPGGTHGRSRPLRRPGTEEPTEDYDRASTGRDLDEDEPNTQLENLEAQSVMRTGMYGPHDALDLLYKAATNKHDEELHQATPSSMSTTQGPVRPDALRKSSHHREASIHPRQISRQDNAVDPAIDPALTKRDPADDLGYGEALKAWARFRFVRAGWFTAQEAIDYIDYYYEYLSPLTPISPPTFRNPASHVTLLTEEPILAVTLLTIATRYRRLQGTGAHCRSHAIHEQMWQYLRSMIERVIWGQEAFGGGFCGSGADTGWGSSNNNLADENWSSSTAPWRGLRKGSLRTLGTIESLLLLTEWHPRSLHFPPNDATDELMLPPPATVPQNAGEENGAGHGTGGRGRRIEGWLEPAWRSDRMSWMLLSTGMGLAYELGVFDDIDDLLATGNITRPEYEEEDYRIRASRIKRLIIIYISQLAGRLGWTNMIPESLRRSDHQKKKRPVSVEGATPGTNQSSLSNTFNYIPDLELDDQIIYCWAGISNAMQYGNEKLFRSRQHTTDIIQSGKYINLLKEFQPILNDWWQHFDRFRLPPFIRHILTIEYEYVRIYVFSLALQAVVERCTLNASGGGGNASGGSVSGQSGPQLSPQTQNYYGKLPLGQLGGFGTEDQEYVKSVVTGSRNLLKTVVNGLRPGDYLKHVPVRTYFRIISGAMFLLKTFAVGAPKNEIEASIQLMDQTVDALRNCIVDDVHLGIRFADMLEQLTGRLRNRFIHAPPPPAPTSDARSPGGTHLDTTNGTAANGGPTGTDWAKREGIVGPERTTTPANISATPWDLNTGTFPFPTGSASMFGPSTPAAHHHLPENTNNTAPAPGSGGSGAGPSGAGGNNSSNMNFDGANYDNSDWNNPGNEMWYLPPGPALFQNIENSAVAMTAEGVNVGGLDLLEYMVMDPTEFGNIDGYQA
ncbi:hypothetical protein GQ53DRAFT_538315 [Thozetella sp. PMI_491]|nr:hypothetical protein GQ53DRAFT_538315 [Thozetella sp. PMI_491]